MNSIGSEIKRTEWKLKKTPQHCYASSRLLTAALVEFCILRSAIHTDYTELPNPTERNVINRMKFNISNIMYPVLKRNDELQRAGFDSRHRKVKMVLSVTQWQCCSCERHESMWGSAGKAWRIINFGAPRSAVIFVAQSLYPPQTHSVSYTIVIESDLPQAKAAEVYSSHFTKEKHVALILPNRSM